MTDILLRKLDTDGILRLTLNDPAKRNALSGAMLTALGEAFDKAGRDPLVRVIVLAARPGRLQEIIDVDLPFPRNDDVRLSPEFTAIRNRVWRAVYHRDAEAA